MKRIVKWMLIAFPVPIAAIILAALHKATIGYYLDCLFLLLCVIVMVGSRPMWRNNILPLSIEQFKDIAAQDRQEQPSRYRLSATIGAATTALPAIISLLIIHRI